MVPLYRVHSYPFLLVKVPLNILHALIKILFLCMHLTSLLECYSRAKVRLNNNSNFGQPQSKMAPFHLDTETQSYFDSIKKHFQDNSRTKDFVGHSAKVI